MPSSLMIDRRFLLAGAAAAMLRPAFAQTLGSPADYPAQRIRILVPATAGDVIDTAVHALLNAMTPDFHSGFQLDRQPTMGGAIAARTVAKADADGYTLLIGTPETQAIAPKLLREPGYDPVADFEAVGGICDIPLVLAARRTLSAETLRQLVELMSAEPQRYRFGSTGAGSLGHMAGELFKLRSRAEAVHVPLPGEAKVMQAILAQQIDFAILPLGAVTTSFRSGQIKLLAQLGAARDKRISTVPTMREAGIANLELSGWFGCYAPAKTANSRLDLLATGFNTAMPSQPIVQMLNQNGLTAALRGPDDLAKLVAADRKLFAELIRLKSLKTG